MKTRNEKAKAIRFVLKTRKAEWDRIGGLSLPSKMPGLSIGIPAKACKTGSKLAKIKGSTCANCYALKGNYIYKNVQRAQERRLKAISSPTWVEDMITVIGESCKALGENYFRFHDAGDLQGPEHFLKIVKIAKALPEISFWLPTKEASLIPMLKGMVLPANLTIRISAFMLNKVYDVGLPSSAVSTHKTWVNKKAIPVPGTVLCKAYNQEGECRDCRLCWDSSVKAISYPKH